MLLRLLLFLITSSATLLADSYPVIYGLDDHKNFRRSPYSAISQINLSESAKEITSFPSRQDPRILTSTEGQEVSAQIRFVDVAKNIAEIQTDSTSYETDMDLFDDPTKSTLLEWQSKNDISNSRLSVTTHMQRRSNDHEHSPFKINQPKFNNVSFDSFSTREHYISFLLRTPRPVDLTDVTAYLGIRIRRSLTSARGYNSKKSRYPKNEIIGNYMLYKTIPNVTLKDNQEAEFFSDLFLLTAGAGTSDSVVGFYLVLEYKREIIFTALSSKILTDYVLFHIKSVQDGIHLPKYDLERR